MSLEVVGSLGVVERHLTRYWIELDFPDGYPPHATRLGIGVTAFDRDDAMRLVAERVFPAGDVPHVREIREGVDVSMLDPGHVLPNMGPPNRRGIWFPLGYD
jgi:hypothetical protein